MNLLAGSLDWCWGRGASQLSEARVPTHPGGRWTLPSPSPVPSGQSGHGTKAQRKPLLFHAQGPQKASTLVPSSLLLCLPSPQRQASAFPGPRPRPGPSCPAARRAAWKAAPFPARPTPTSCQVTRAVPGEGVRGGDFPPWGPAPAPCCPPRRSLT